MDGVTILAVSHQMTALSQALFVLGVAVGLTAGVCAFGLLILGEWRIGSYICILTVLCALAAYQGWTLPRDRIVKAVLSPGVDFGKLAERYDVVRVEGQFFELRELKEN